MERVGFFLYLIFIVSWFLRLTARFPALGIIRLDMLLATLILIIFLFFVEKQDIKVLNSQFYKNMMVFFIIVLATIPFAEWPGSAIKFGLPNFIKAIAFFFFSVWFVRTEWRIKVFMLIFLICQSFRILEPLYLHITIGYWGSTASMANWEYMYRLSGAPTDVINPNGLAFVILTVLSFLIFLFKENIIWRILAVSVIPPSLYALYLTGSRSGMLGLFVILIIFILRSKNKVLLLVPIIAGCLFAFSNMDTVYFDRYISIIVADSANAETAQGRIDGVIDDIKVGMRRPLFGHGLGTSMEANANFGTKAQISHNLYAETFQELGIIGLLFFLIIIISIFRNILKSKYNNGFLHNFRNSLLMFSSMNLFFSLASYGLSSYEWYLLAALSINITELKKDIKYEKKDTLGHPMAGWRNKDLHPLRLS